MGIKLDDRESLYLFQFKESGEVGTVELPVKKMMKVKYGKKIIRGWIIKGECRQ